MNEPFWGCLPLGFLKRRPDLLGAITALHPDSGVCGDNISPRTLLTEYKKCQNKRKIIAKKSMDIFHLIIRPKSSVGDSILS